MITLLASGCLKFSDDGGGSSSSSSSAPSIDLSNNKVESGTIDLTPRNTFTLDPNGADANKLKYTFITVLGNGSISLSSGFARNYLNRDSNKISSQYGLKFITVKESYNGRTVETIFNGNLIDINYSLKL
jgi:hypothetical protein